MSLFAPTTQSPLLRSFDGFIRYWIASTPGRCLHTTTLNAANPLPIGVAGPPPSAPIPAASQYGERVDRRRRQAELLKRGQEMRIDQKKPGSALKKRFWKDVNVHTESGNLHQILVFNS